MGSSSSVKEPMGVQGLSALVPEGPDAVAGDTRMGEPQTSQARALGLRQAPAPKA